MANVTVFARRPTTKVTATMVIKDFVEELTKEPGRYFESNTFLVNEAQMRLRVYPNGAEVADRGFVLAAWGTWARRR